MGEWKHLCVTPDRQLSKMSHRSAIFGVKLLLSSNWKWPKKMVKEIGMAFIFNFFLQLDKRMMHPFSILATFQKSISMVDWK